MCGRRKQRKKHRGKAETGRGCFPSRGWKKKVNKTTEGGEEGKTPAAADYRKGKCSDKGGKTVNREFYMGCGSRLPEKGKIDKIGAPNGHK